MSSLYIIFSFNLSRTTQLYHLLIVTVCLTVFHYSHASFYGVLPDKSLLDSFKVDISELPALYLVAEAGDSLVPFPGEVRQWQRVSVSGSEWQ